MLWRWAAVGFESFFLAMLSTRGTAAALRGLLFGPAMLFPGLPTLAARSIAAAGFETFFKGLHSRLESAKPTRDARLFQEREKTLRRVQASLREHGMMQIQVP